MAEVAIQEAHISLPTLQPKGLAEEILPLPKKVKRPKQQPKTCSVCDHPERQQIERRILSEPIKTILADYPNCELAWHTSVCLNGNDHESFFWNVYKINQ